MPATRTNPWVAVDPVVDRLQQARELRKIYDAFHAGENICTVVRRVVGQSWGRSEDAGLDPSRVPPIVIDEREVQERWQRHPLFAVLPALRELLADATTSSEHMLVITDADGVILWIEGDRRVIAATQEMHAVSGADWSELAAGTNAVGTAITVDHPVQIFSAEHFSRIHHRWQSSSAPIHDPDTEELLGVISLTGHLRTAHPHTLSLVSAAARLAEALLREQARTDVDQLRDAYLARIIGKRQSTALIGRGGRTLMEVPRRWAPAALDVPRGGGEVLLPDGRVATAEPLPGGRGAYILWGPPPSTGAITAMAYPAALDLELLGRSPVARVHGQTLALTLRHAELLALLLLDGRGLTAEQLAIEIYGAHGKSVTVRAELSRLRRALSGVLQARPYRLIGDVRADVLELQRAVGTADLHSLLDRYPGPFLDGSSVPLIVRTRGELDAAIRHRVMLSCDPGLLARWCATPSGARDSAAAELLLTLLPADDYRRAPAHAQVERLRQTVA